MIERLRGGQRRSVTSAGRGWSGTPPSHRETSGGSCTFRARAAGFNPSVPIEEGVRDTMQRYAANKDRAGGRYNVLTEPQVITTTG